MAGSYVFSGLIIILQILQIWSLSPALVVKTTPAGNYSVFVKGQRWLQSDTTFLRAQHNLWTTQNNTLVLCGSQSFVSGTDRIGRWEMIKYAYRQETSSRCVMNVTIKSYTDKNVVIFSQAFPEGLHNTSSGNMDETVSSFPSFIVQGDGSRGLIAFGGLFNFEGLQIQRFTKHLKIKDGMECGPLVFFDKSGSTLVVSSFSQFMASSMWYDRSRESLHWGVMGKAARIPAQFSTETVLFYSPDGVNKAVSSWGETLRMWYNKDVKREPSDLSVSHLGYYTDNGAYYYHNMKFPFKNYEQMLEAVAQDKRTPYRYLQYDDWWYFITGPGYGATTRWEPMPSIFPHGLEYLYKKTGLPVVAHNRYWSSKTPYAIQNGGKFKFITYQRISLPVEERFWDWLFNNARQWGMVTYEQDWLNYQTERIQQLHSDVELSSLWLKQMGNAATRYNLTIQYCMALPRHFLQSLQIPAVTQIRVSSDYPISNEQWRIGVSSMLATAVGLAPFKDNFWSSTVEVGNPYNRTEKCPLLQAMVAILSAGPVAPGDGYGFSHPNLISRLHRYDGLLLKPGKPAHAIDAQIYEMAFGDGSGPKGEVWSSYTDISRLRFGIIFAANLSRPYSISPSQASQGPQTHRTVAYSYREQGAPELVDFGEEHWLRLVNCPTIQPCLWYTTPVLSLSGRNVMLLGELDKFIPMSRQRVLKIVMPEDDIQVVITGGIGETVTFSIHIDNRVVNITCNQLGQSGLAMISIRLRQCFVIYK